MRAERVRARGTDVDVPLADEHLTVEPDYSDARDLCDERIERREVGGRAVVVKRSRGPARSALRREATVLGALAGTAVVELVEHRSGPTVDELWTVDGGPASLADPWSGSPVERAAWFADGCRRLAELHARGWFHGAVTLDHLVVDDLDGATRWCSLGSAGRVADDPGGQRLDRIAITRAAHRLARSLPGSLGLRRRLDRLGDEADPRRIARAFQHWAGRRGATARTERHRRPRRPATGSPATRPTWPRWRPPIGVAVRHLPTAVAVRHLPTAVAVRHLPTAVAVTAVSAVVLVVLAGGASRPTRPVTPSTTGPEQPGASRPAAGDPSSADPVPTDASAPSVVAGGRTLRVGRPGDVAVVADARCSGLERVFVLRPETGEVFDLPAPPPTPPDAGAGTTVPVGRLLLRDAGLVDLVAPPGCGPPRASRRDGSATAVIPP